MFGGNEKRKWQLVLTMYFPFKTLSKLEVKLKIEAGHSPPEHQYNKQIRQSHTVNIRWIRLVSWSNWMMQLDRSVQKVDGNSGRLAGCICHSDSPYRCPSLDRNSVCCQPTWPPTSACTDSCCDYICRPGSHDTPTIIKHVTQCQTFKEQVYNIHKNR